MLWKYACCKHLSFIHLGIWERRWERIISRIQPQGKPELPTELGAECYRHLVKAPVDLIAALTESASWFSEGGRLCNVSDDEAVVSESGNGNWPMELRVPVTRADLG